MSREATARVGRTNTMPADATATEGFDAATARTKRPATRRPAPTKTGSSRMSAAPGAIQPLYSHKTHVSRGLQCQQCHINPDPGREMTFPAVGTCMGCHNSVAKERPAILKLAELAKSGQPIPWVRVYEVTPGVTWSHRRHLEAGMQCVMCHGRVDQFDALGRPPP